MFWIRAVKFTNLTKVTRFNINLCCPCSGFVSLLYLSRVGGFSEIIMAKNHALPDLVAVTEIEADHHSECHFTESCQWLNLTIVLCWKWGLECRCKHRRSISASNPLQSVCGALSSMILCLSKALSAPIQGPLLSAFIIDGPQQDGHTHTHISGSYHISEEILHQTLEKSDIPIFYSSYIFHCFICETQC